MPRFKFHVIPSIIGALALLLSTDATAEVFYASLSDYGLRPNKSMNSRDKLSERFACALKSAMRLRSNPADTIIIQLAPGDYYFASTRPHSRQFFISNHDHADKRYVGLALDSLTNVIIDGQGSTLFFEAPAALPIAMTNCSGCSLKNLSIDYPKPHILQAVVMDNDTVAGDITMRLPDYAEYKIKNGKVTVTVDGNDVTPYACIAFEDSTGRVAYRTSDVGVWLDNPRKIDKRTLKVAWRDTRLTSGMRLALRTYSRPAPAIFIDGSSDLLLKNVTVHYAEGMGLLAQNSSNITLRGFNVKRSNRYPERMHTTQADATHFSGCRGVIVSVGGLYEGMMDDAINIHGTYLKVTDYDRESRKVSGGFMHHQSFGFDWGLPGDSVAFVRSATLEPLNGINVIENIEAIRDSLGVVRGYCLTLADTLPAGFNPETDALGIENLSATPEVYFANNTIRNNRARGALFSSPRRTVVENNVFDHTSGTAILLCGDCNGWFESGACHDVVIRKNRFINALTSLYQFTNAIISIYPEIPQLDKQQYYFHSGIEITDNYFSTFDAPILYAKSVDGLKFLGNTIEHNHDFKPFHHINVPFFFEKVTNVSIE